MAAGGFAPASGSATTQPKPARVTKKADEKSASKARTVLRVQANAQAAKAAKDDERQEKEIARMEAALKAAKAARAAAKVQHNAPSADENGSGGSDSGESDEDLAEGDDDDDLAGKSRGTDIAGYESSDDNQDGASSSVGLAHVSMRDRYAKAQPQQPLPPPPPARRSAARDAGRSSDDEHNWDAVEYLANKQRPSALPMAGPAPPGTMETAKLTAAKAVNSFTSVTHKLSMSQLARAALLVGADWWTSSTPTVPQAIFEAGVGSLVVDKLFSSALGTARTQVVGSVQEKATKALNPNALVAARDPEAVNKIVHDGPVLALGPQSPMSFAQGGLTGKWAGTSRRKSQSVTRSRSLLVTTPSSAKSRSMFWAAPSRAAHRLARSMLCASEPRQPANCGPPDRQTTARSRIAISATSPTCLVGSFAWYLALSIGTPWPNRCSLSFSFSRSTFIWADARLPKSRPRSLHCSRKLSRQFAARKPPGTPRYEARQPCRDFLWREWYPVLFGTAGARATQTEPASVDASMADLREAREARLTAAARAARPAEPAEGGPGVAPGVAQ